MGCVGWVATCIASFMLSHYYVHVCYGHVCHDIQLQLIHYVLLVILSCTRIIKRIRQTYEEVQVLEDRRMVDLEIMLNELHGAVIELQREDRLERRVKRHEIKMGRIVMERVCGC